MSAQCGTLIVARLVDLQFAFDRDSVGVKHGRDQKSRTRLPLTAIALANAHIQRWLRTPVADGTAQAATCYFSIHGVPSRDLEAGGRAVCA